jgi:hypothetical protein
MTTIYLKKKDFTVQKIFFNVFDEKCVRTEKKCHYFDVDDVENGKTDIIAKVSRP